MNLIFVQLHNEQNKEAENKSVELQMRLLFLKTDVQLQRKLIHSMVNLKH